MLLHTHTVLAVPQLNLEDKFCIPEGFLDLGRIQNYVNSIVNDIIQGDFFISIQYLECFGHSNAIDDTWWKYQI